jgi:uncharacterized protein Yka (UPF0111/DUF47 family)
VDITAVLNSAAELGIVGTIAIVLLLAYRDMSNKMTDVVRNNTEAITRLCGSSENTEKLLGEHDERAQRVEQTIGQVARVVDRTEQKVDAIHQSIRQGK